MITKLIADSGATKCNWYVLSNHSVEKINSQGLNPYHLSTDNIDLIIKNSVAEKLKKCAVDEIYFYGAGMSNSRFKTMMKRILAKNFPQAKSFIETDLVASARATCGNTKGVVSILGTGSGCAYYNGKRIAKVQNGIGYALGDEGSGAYLGRKLIQYFLYNTLDEELLHAFNQKYAVGRDDILNKVYRQPLPAKYLASFTLFLAEHRGHYMIENIIEDGLTDFIITHIYKFREAWLYPLHFTGGTAFAFKDVIKDLCSSYGLEVGKILQDPLDELIKYHQ